MPKDANVAAGTLPMPRGAPVRIDVGRVVVVAGGNVVAALEPNSLASSLVLIAPLPGWGGPGSGLGGGTDMAGTVTTDPFALRRGPLLP